MQHTFNYPGFGSPNVHSRSPAFNVVIAYEDFDTGNHAKRTYDFLVESLGRDCESHNQMWKFDVLSISKLQAIAAKDATAADIVIISCHGEELPAQVRDWIEAWVSAPGGPMALLAGGSGESNHVRAYLEQVARRKQIEFFAQPDQGTSRLPGDLGLQMNRGLGDRALTTLAGAADRDITPHWGINE